MASLEWKLIIGDGELGVRRYWATARPLLTTAGASAAWGRTARGRAAATSQRIAAQEESEARWLFGDSAFGLRMQAAESLAREFGTDVSEWTV